MAGASMPGSDRRNLRTTEPHAPASKNGTRPEDSLDLATVANAVPSGVASRPQPGGRFGRYRIERQLGEGAMGTVYLAHDTALERNVALKIPKFDPSDADARSRFLREARSVAALRHPHLCPIHDVGEIDGTQYLTMAFIEGRTLADHLESGRPIAPRQAALVIRKLALGLQEAHAAGVIHRDLKPANVMLDKKGEPVVMDFGLARPLQAAEAARITHSGQLVGTPAYMPPEQAQGRLDELGPASDVYSLGVIFYEMLTGRRPFDGPLAPVLAAILTETPPAPREIRPDVDPALEAVCLKMMSKRAADRFALMRDVADALKSCLSRPAPVVAVTIAAPEVEPAVVSGIAPSRAAAGRARVRPVVNSVSERKKPTTAS